MPLNIGIAGAGLMGRMLACQLVDAGHKVTLFDRDPIAQGSAAGFTAAGMLTPYAEVESAEPIVYELGMRSLQLWPELIKKFSPMPRFNSRGSLVLAHPSDIGDLRQFQTQVQRKLSPSDKQLQTVSTTQIQQLEPELGHHFAQGIYLPEEAWVSAEDFMAASSEYLLARDVDWHFQCEVTDIQAHTLKTADHTWTFDIAVDTRGTGAKPQWQQLRGVRGELLWLQAPEVNISRLVRLMHPRYRLYLVPLMKDDLYIVGATQIESDDRSAISVRSCLELLSAVYSLHSGFAEARIVKTATNCRPALMDNLPKAEIRDGLIRINGLFRHGYLLAPAISEQVSNWISDAHQSSTEQSPQNVLDIAV